MKPNRISMTIVAFTLAAAISTEAMAVIRVTVRPVTLQAASAGDTSATLPTSQTQFTPGQSFVLELWAQTTETNGLSSVTVDMSFVNTVVTAQTITHNTLFNAAGLSTGSINNPAGLIDDIGGSHPAASPPCSDQVGLTNWVRVATVNMQALANGTSLIQSADTASMILGIAMCNEFGNVLPVDVDFGQVTVTVMECFNNADCDDAAFCNGPETCVLNVCQPGTPPAISDGVACTDDSCDEINDVVVHTPNNANCDNGLFCDGAETCDLTLDCQAGTAPTLSDGVICTDDGCDEVNDVVVHTPNNANCDNGLFCDGAETCDLTLDCQAGTAPTLSDGVVCTDDSCDEINDVVVHTPNNANCVNGLFCDGAETCDLTLDCQVGAAVCTASCEHCDEAGGTCELCILDLDVNGVMGTGDFALFAACFDGCYLASDPCAASNFDGDSGICVGTGDYSGFVGCFGQTCSACANCAGPPPAGVSSRSFARGADANISLVIVSSPTVDDSVAILPASENSIAVDQPFFVEVWATRPNALDRDGIAAAFVDLSFDANKIVADKVIYSNSMSTFAGGEFHPGLGLVSQLGGCSKLDATNLGADGNWVRVTTLAVRAVGTGYVTMTASPSDLNHGVAIVNDLGNIDPFRVDFGMSAVKIIPKTGIDKATRRLR